MIVNLNGEVYACTSNVQHLTKQGSEYWWTGLIFVAGRIAGYDSVEFVADHIDQHGIAPFAHLRGSFFITIRRPDGVVTAFTDNSGMHGLFVSTVAISNRFLPLLEHISQHGSLELTLSVEALAHNYSVGRTLSDRTPIQQVTLLDKYQYVEIKDGGLYRISKGIPDIDACNSSFDPDDFFDSIALALKEYQASVALTGGYDSRLVFSYLKNRMNVEPTLSGDIVDHPDVKIATRVASQAGKNLNLVRTTKPRFGDEDVYRMFWEYDGLCGFTDPASVRLSNYFDFLHREGFGVHVTGDGGVLHKDWEWMQDLPFYRRKKTDLGRFYDQRLGFNHDARGAGPLIRGDTKSMRASVILGLRPHVRAWNTQSYDMLYYHLNGRRTLYYNLQLGNVVSYAPLMERELVAYSYALPRHRRFFNNNIRALTTAQDPVVAKVPTVYGTTASSDRRLIARDVVYQGLDYARKAVRMTGRKVLGRTLFAPRIVSWDLTQELREIEITTEAIVFARSIGLVDDTETTQSLSARHLDCVLQTFFIAKTAGILRGIA